MSIVLRVHSAVGESITNMLTTQKVVKNFSEKSKTSRNGKQQLTII